LQIQAVSIVTYVGSLLGIVLMYVWYAPSPACRLNILFITVTLALVQLMTFVSMSSKASELRHTHNNTCSVWRWRPFITHSWGLEINIYTGEGRVRGAGADGDLRRVPVLVGDQKVRSIDGF
jgi:hypothetical protein